MLPKKQLVMAVSLAWGITPLGAIGDDVVTQGVDKARAKQEAPSPKELTAAPTEVSGSTVDPSVKTEISLV